LAVKNLVIPRSTFCEETLSAVVVSEVQRRPVRSLSRPDLGIPQRTPRPYDSSKPSTRDHTSSARRGAARRCRCTL
jgi:hypothetical protein